MKKVIIVLLFLLVITGIIRAVYEYKAHKEERAAAVRFDARQKAVKQRGGVRVQMMSDASEMEKIFYQKLKTCFPENLATEDNTNYVIYGIQNDKCVFEKFVHVFCLHCEVPMAVAKKYSESGLLTADYVNEVNNNPQYCNIVLENPDKPKDEKDKKTTGNKPKKKHIKHNSNKTRR